MRKAGRRWALAAIGGALWAAVLAVAPVPAMGQIHAAVLTDAQQALLDRVASYLDALKTLKGRFVQVGQDGKTSTGTVWLDRPGRRMRFQYDPPSPLLLVASHGTVIFHDSALGQTTRIPVGQTPLGLLLSDHIALRGEVTVTDFVESQGQVVTTLARTASPGDGSLTLDLNASPLALVGWTVVDAEGRETRLRISNIVPGGEYRQSLFEFNDPDEGR